ncbi:MAG: uroporphyrinogen-III synthase [Chlamydiia bacterium]|nr:uroporphyrinogen-III synthase [Chlamydiia bacterium]
MLILPPNFESKIGSKGPENRQKPNPFTVSKRVLYLGIDPPEGRAVDHYPVIRTSKLESHELSIASDRWEEFSHVIFTSKNGVRYWEKWKSAEGKIFIAIGEGTAGELRGRGIQPLVASDARQEGVIALLEGLCLEGASVLYLRSRRARPLLAEYLARNINAVVVDLYDTVIQCPRMAPDLSLYEEIVFTSPSTVEGFLKIFGKLPEGIRLTAIGAVTRAALMSIMLLYTRSTSKAPKVNRFKFSQIE